ncbi:MAG TPA: site-2 protease family protein [Actinophytocola sp.]|uniref:M50 family metallopeptidase n=1 Tax=Actinophytocola sp. TaxID=1872138 RepID=UPI002DDCA4DF|nr:site-2 protease family protein [Actinophytocola sp.]HEV2782685.1 site-2 protease family protein [Actinophytocola sp.]
MLVWILGVALFALGICVSVALHEAGHMLTAKWFGMKVRRYFIGFGPRLWSFRRGETEYGLKAIPLGGFCDIAGMTALDHVSAAEAPRAMWRFPVWKRVVVMSAGSITHFILGFLILYFMAVGMGLPNVAGTPVISATDCAAASQDPKTFEFAPCTPGDRYPARDAGIQPGDEIISIDGQRTATWTEVVAKVKDLRGAHTFVLRRDGVDRTVTVDIPQVQRVAADARPGADDNRVVTVGAIGVRSTPVYHYDAVGAFGGAASFTGDMFVRTWQGLLAFPQKIPKVVEAIGGGERDPDTPVSVVGASIIGGDAVERGIWELFLLVLASLNFFVGVFNLLPLLPLDGGHIAVTLYEKVRDWVRKLRGLAPGGPVDYTKLTAVTMVVVFLGGAVVLLTVTADLVNPIRIGQ